MGIGEMRQDLTRPCGPRLLSIINTSEGPKIADILSDFAFLILFRIVHVIPAAANKQIAPPTTAPITIMIIGLVLVESLLELELSFTDLAVWLDTVLVSAVQSNIHYKDASRISTSNNLTKFEAIN